MKWTLITTLRHMDPIREELQTSVKPGVRQRGSESCVSFPRWDNVDIRLVTINIHFISLHSTMHYLLCTNCAIYSIWVGSHPMT